MARYKAQPSRVWDNSWTVFDMQQRRNQWGERRAVVVAVTEAQARYYERMVNQFGEQWLETRLPA